MATRAASSPATAYVPEGQLRGWFVHAVDGASAYYALGGAVDPAHPSAQLVAAWVKAGTARTATGTYRKAPMHRVIRLRVPGAGPLAPSLPPGALPPTWEHRREGALYRLLCARAAAGAMCPSRSEIAELLGLDTRRAAQTLFEKLVAAGAVRVVEQPPRTVPVIEIVATAKRTSSTVSGAKS